MLYSFIIPVYNCRDYLEACVCSIREAQKQNYEILLVDDGSTDDSAQLCDDLAKTYREVRCVHQENQGASMARNRGIQEAQGEFILFIDADDSLESAVLHRVLNIVPEQYADLYLFGMTFDYYYRGSCYRRDDKIYPQGGMMARSAWLSDFYNLYDCNMISPVWNKVFRRKILTDNHIQFDRTLFLYEDLEFVLRYLAHCEKLWNLPEAIYHYRQTEDEGNAGRRLKTIENLSNLVRKIEYAANNMLYVRKSKDIGISIQIDYMILQLYIVIAKEKIAVSDLDGIREICVHFSEWYTGKQFSNQCEYIRSNQIFINRLLKQQVFSLWFRKNYTALRHKVAVVIKNTAWYQKRKGGGREC